jgi:hypothetical protein
MAARNHWNADAAATPHGAPPPPWSPVDTGLVLPQSLTVPSLVGSPSFVLPPPLSDVVPAGHVDDLQTVAQAFRTAHDTIDDVSTGLHNALEFLFSNNQSADLDALNQFWDHVGGNAGILGALRQACDQIATAVQDYANWTIDTQNKNPDYRIEGQIFDNIAPNTGNARNIADRITEKVTENQADRIVLNLSDSSVDLSTMSAQLHDWPIQGLKEVKVIDAQGNVIDFYP